MIEQITYLIFIKRLDEMQELEERKATTLGKPIERRIFPEGKDHSGEPYANLRWSRFKHFAGPEMFRLVDEHVFPFIRELSDQGTSYARHMRDARFQIPGRRAARQGGRQARQARHGRSRHQRRRLRVHAGEDRHGRTERPFRTPRHIIATMIELVRPNPEDVTCDPACGTCGFLVAAGEYLRRHHPELFRDDKFGATSTRACSTVLISTRRCCASAR